jgi:hypothetical protein
MRHERRGRREESRPLNGLKKSEFILGLLKKNFTEIATRYKTLILNPLFLS